MNSYKNSQSGRKLWTLSTKPPDNGDGAIVVAWNKKEDKYFERNISMVITDLTYRCSRLLTQSGKLQIHSYQYLKPVIYHYIQKNYHIAETMHLLSNCYQESKSPSQVGQVPPCWCQVVTKRSLSSHQAVPKSVFFCQVSQHLLC